MFEVPAAKRTLKQNVFEFKIGTKAYTVPKFEYLPVGVLETIEATAADAVGPFLDVFGAKDSAVGKAVRTLDKDQLIALIKAWQVDSDVTVGESKGS